MQFEDSADKVKKMKIEKRLERATKANFDPFIEIVEEGRSIKE